MFRISDITSMIRGWRLPARVYNTRAVLADAWPALVALLGVIGASAIGAISYWRFRHDPGTAVTITGVILDWLGLAIVAKGIVTLRQRFKRPSWFGRLWQALRRPQDVTIQLSGVGAISVAGTAALAVGSVANPTIEQRLDMIESSIKQIRTDLDDRAQSLKKAVDSVKADVQRETNHRAVAIHDVLQQIEDIAAGGINLEGIGLCWLLLGVLFTSLPDQIGALLQTIF